LPQLGYVYFEDKPAIGGQAGRRGGPLRDGRSRKDKRPELMLGPFGEFLI
jgi:hypothetical protein